MYKCAEDSSCKRADQPAIQRGQTVSKLEKVTNALDERGLGVAPRVANVDDEGNPAIVDDSLTVTLTLSPDVPPAQERETYASELDGLDDPFLQTKSAQRRRSTRGGRSPLSPLKAFWVVRGTVTEEGVSGNA